MTIQTVNIGSTPNDGTGDDPRTGISKLNANFTDSANAASKLVQTSATDATADRVMLVWEGAGLETVDANTRVSPGKEFWSGTSTNLPSASAFLVDITVGAVSAGNVRVVQKICSRFGSRQCNFT